MSQHRGRASRAGTVPTPRRFDNANHGLPARMDVDMFDSDLLLTLATVAI